MITAKEARELAGPTFDEMVKEQLEFAYEQIRLATENRKREVVLHSEFWTRGGYNQAPEYQAAINKLIKTKDCINEENGEIHQASW